MWDVRVAVRCAFQPFRIVVTYMQITSQVGPVLRIRFPAEFDAIVQVMKSVNFWDHLFDAECEGLDGFASMWAVRVVALPGILAGCILLYFMIERLRPSSREDKNAAATRLPRRSIGIAIVILAVILAPYEGTPYPQ